jgi:hypothetical protein
MSSTNSGKDVVYVDVDDEITGIIDKVTSSGEKIVALVLPKRASVFQSIVNMKLLKKRADGAKKHLVLITSESSLMPLAGDVGLYVAKTLQSKPEIPESTVSGTTLDDDDQAVPVDGEFDPSKAKNKPIGDLADKTGAASQMPEETIELDNTDAEASGASAGGDKNVAALAAGGAAGKAGKHGKDKKLHVPNFEKFRLKLVLGALGVIVLGVGWFVAFNILPAAKVVITTNASNVNSTPTLTLDTNAASVNEATDTLPAQTQQIQKTYTQTADATGKQNNGTKATGQVTLSLTDCAQNSVTVPAGTGLSGNGLTFITQSAVTLNSVQIGGVCHNDSTNSSAAVGVAAQSGGTQYNIGASSFTVAGFSDVTGSSSDPMSGGTDNIVTVVQQSDIDGATAKLTAGQDTGSIKQQLQQQLQASGLYAITDTFSAGKPSTTASAKTGDTANNVTLTENVTYMMFGAKKADLQKVLDDQVNKQIDASKQSILDDGLANASFTVPNPGSATKVAVALQATSIIGPKLNQAQLKSQIAGTKSGDAEKVISGIPDVEKVSVRLSPFWVSHVPKKASKINFVFVKSSATNNGSR